MQVTIIGAGSGISRAVAQLFGSKGFRVALIARREDKLRTQVEELKSMGIGAMYATADAGDEQSLYAAMEQVRNEFGHADMILYNAFAYVAKKVENETWESISRQMNVNVGGAFHLLKKVLPYYRQTNAGKIFFTGGALALYPQPALAGLSMGKAALRNLVLGTAASVTGTNVHIATVTVAGYVKADDPKHNPQAIAEQFWKLYNQKQGEFETEVVY